GGGRPGRWRATHRGAAIDRRRGARHAAAGRPASSTAAESSATSTATPSTASTTAPAAAAKGITGEKPKDQQGRTEPSKFLRHRMFLVWVTPRGCFPRERELMESLV